MSKPTPCPTCAEYAEKRLPSVIWLWFQETRRVVNVASFLRGVHARHLAGKAVLPS